MKRIFDKITSRKNQKSSDKTSNISDSLFHEFYYARKNGPHKQICYAAEKSMYFGKDGNVSACCYNRLFVFGNIANQTIDDIWRGPKIKELSNSLKDNDLLKGCFACKLKIQSGNYGAVGSLAYDNIPYNSNWPTQIDFDLSNECNLECIMCNSENSSSHSKRIHGTNINPGIYDDNFLKQLDLYIPNLYTAGFYGGEPFIIPMYYQIWEKIITHNPNCHIVVQTNATVLNDKIKDMLEKGNFNISISIESFRKETYEKIRKNAEFDRVLKNINYFSNHAKRHNYKLNISVCPMQQNWKELPEIILMANEFAATIYFNTVLNPAQCSLHSLTHNELSEIIRELSYYTLPENNTVEKQNKTHYQGFLEQLKVWQHEKENTSLHTHNLTEELSPAEIEKLSVEELCTMLFDKIKNEKNPSIYVVEDLKRLDEAHSKLLEVALKFENNNKIKHYLFDMMKKEGEVIIQKICFRDKDTLYQKIKRKIENE